MSIVKSRFGRARRRVTQFSAREYCLPYVGKCLLRSAGAELGGMVERATGSAKWFNSTKVFACAHAAASVYCDIFLLAPCMHLISTRIPTVMHNRASASSLSTPGRTLERRSSCTKVSSSLRATAVWCALLSPPRIAYLCWLRIFWPWNLV